VISKNILLIVSLAGVLLSVQVRAAGSLFAEGVRRRAGPRRG